MTTTPVPPGGGAPRRPKPLPFRIGVGFAILTGLLYLSALVTLFLPLDPAAKAATIGAEIVVAEVSFLIGVAFIGKEAYRALKARFWPRRGRRRDASDDAS